MVPLLFGIFVLAPPQVYYQRVSHAQYEGSFIQFYPRYFKGFYGFGGNFAWMGLHLWFLLFLFLFSLTALPLFVSLRNGIGHRFISHLAAFCEKRGALFLLAVPQAVTMILLDPRRLTGQEAFGGWNLFIYLILFLYGYIFAADARYSQVIGRLGSAALSMAIAASGMLFFLYILGNAPVFGSPKFIFSATIRAFNSWFWIIAILSFGQRYLVTRNRFLGYANEAVLPFYILHQTLIVTVGFYVVQWDTGIIVKYLVISTASLAAIMAIYELFVKRISVVRFLFGMKRHVLRGQ